MSAATQLKSAGQREAALVKYQQAVEICPDYADGFYDLGLFYSEASQVGLPASLKHHGKAAMHCYEHFWASHCHKLIWAFHLLLKQLQTFSLLA